MGFSNGSELEWVQEKEFSKGEQIGKITKTTNKSHQFKSCVASKLPVETKTFRANDGTSILIVEYNNKEVIYML
jgi:hypothetical protein